MLETKDIPKNRDDIDYGTFREEADLMKSLSHPGVVKLRKFAENQDHFIMTLEKVDGPNLRQLLV